VSEGWVRSAIGMLTPYGRLRRLHLQTDHCSSSLLSLLPLLPSLESLHVHGLTIPQLPALNLSSTLRTLTRLSTLELSVLVAEEAFVRAGPDYEDDYGVVAESIGIFGGAAGFPEGMLNCTNLQHLSIDNGETCGGDREEILWVLPVDIGTCLPMLRHLAFRQCNDAERAARKHWPAQYA